MVTTWTNATGDGNVNNPANWDNGLPLTGDDAVFYGSVPAGDMSHLGTLNSVTVRDIPSRQAAYETLGDEWDGIDLRPVDEPIVVG